MGISGQLETGLKSGKIIRVNMILYCVSGFETPVRIRFPASEEKKPFKLIRILSHINIGVFLHQLYFLI